MFGWINNVWNWAVENIKAVVAKVGAFVSPVTTPVVAAVSSACDKAVVWCVAAVEAQAASPSTGNWIKAVVAKVVLTTYGYVAVVSSSVANWVHDASLSVWNFVKRTFGDSFWWATTAAAYVLVAAQVWMLVWAVSAVINGALTGMFGAAMLFLLAVQIRMASGFLRSRFEDSVVLSPVVEFADWISNKIEGVFYAIGSAIYNWMRPHPVVETIEGKVSAAKAVAIEVAEEAKSAIGGLIEEARVAFCDRRREAQRRANRQGLQALLAAEGK